MPKMKTKSAAKKRFRVTGSGKVKFKQAFARHMMMKKPKTMKRKARGMSILEEQDGVVILDNFLPYERAKRRTKRNPSPAEKKAAVAAKSAVKAEKPAKKAPAKASKSTTKAKGE
jgi:large subunit ribosomal protein L35